MVVQTDVDKYGKLKMEECDFPITSAKCVHTIVTHLAVFDVDHEKGLKLRKYNPNSSIDDVREKIAADFAVGDDCKPWKVRGMMLPSRLVDE